LVFKKFKHERRSLTVEVGTFVPIPREHSIVSLTLEYSDIGNQ